MKTAFLQAIELMMSGNETLLGIIGVTMKMCLASSLIALLIGVPLGVILAMTTFPGKKALVVLNRTMTGMPPVVCGLLCYMLFSGVGPLRHLHLLFTVEGMIIAQVILLVPIVIGNMETYITGIAEPILETSRRLRLPRARIFRLAMNESRYQICSTYLMVFARASAEVGAVSMVGGAIAYKTNVITTAIMMYTNMGDFTLGVALGIILLFLSLILNISVFFIQQRWSR